MPVDFDRHNSVFNRHFGETDPATYTHLAGEAPYDLSYVRANLLVAFPDGSSNAMEAIWVQRSTFLLNPAAGDTILIGAKFYRVVGVRDDRAGGVYLGLN